MNKKFDYEAVAGAISTIETAITTIEGAINDKIVNQTYKSGNAKDAVEGYIASLNSCMDPINPELELLKTKLNEVKAAYEGAEQNINIGLSGSGPNS